jgi:Ferritin-like domain
VSTTRRQLFGRGAGIVGAAAVPSSLIPATAALAQASDETDALEPVVELEQAAELAYSLAAEDGDLKGDAQDAFELFTAQCGDHAVALSEALDQLGVDPPEAQSDPAEYESLADFDPKAPEKQQLEFMIGLEEDLIAAYRELTPDLEAPDLVRTAAQVAASHAQMLVALRVLAGEPEARLTELP